MGEDQSMVVDCSLVTNKPITPSDMEEIRLRWAGGYQERLRFKIKNFLTQQGYSPTSYRDERTFVDLTYWQNP